MGTNFYLNKRGMDRYKDHVGKRSAAGLYCWDCRLTLCKGGEEKIHFSEGDKFHKACPKCGKKPKDEGWGSSAGRELGFNKGPFKPKKGVASCASFTWAMPEDDLAKFLDKTRKKKPIVDEYGTEFSADEFVEILEECPVRYHHSIGQEFS